MMTTALPRYRQRTVPVSARAGSSGGQEISYEREDWITQAACRRGDPDALFVRGAQQRKAAEVCRSCPVLVQCRAEALDHRVEFGVWGGLTERQRRALLRHNTHVEDWAGYLAAGGELHGI